MPPSRGGWRLVLDRAPGGERLPAASSLIAAGGAAPGPAGGVTVGEGGGAFSAGGRAGPAASDAATFFSVTITVKAPERRDGEHQEITGAVKTYATKNTTEGLLVQSVAGGCLTLRGAILFTEAREAKVSHQSCCRGERAVFCDLKLKSKFVSNSGDLCRCVVQNPTRTRPFKKGSKSLQQLRASARLAQKSAAEVCTGPPRPPSL